MSILKKIIKRLGFNPIALYPLLHIRKYLGYGVDNFKYEDYDSCWKDLNAIHSFSGYGSCLCHNKMDIKYNLQIIVPAYNAEKYIEKCLDSILFQNTSFSYIVSVVNDGSTDDTHKILEKYKKETRIELIEQENQGFSGARNRALDNIRGQYIMFVDSDDYLPKGAIQTLMQKAMSCHADIVEGSYSNFYDSSSKSRIFPHKSVDCGKDYSSLYGYPWGKVIRSDLFKYIHFPEKYWFEDTIMSFIIYPKAKKIVTVSDMVYRYRVNFSGITQSSKGKLKMIDTLGITRLVMSEGGAIGILTDNRLLNTFLLQVKINAQRILSLKRDDIDRKVFIIHRMLLMHYFNDLKTKNKYQSYLQEALLNNDFKGYQLYMALA